MKIVKHVRIYYPFELEGRKDDFVPRDMTEAEFKKYQLRPDASHFSIYYTIEEKVLVKYSSEPLCFETIKFYKEDLSHLPLKTQVQDMLDRMPTIKTGSVNGAKTRYIQAYYEYANEEISRCKKYVVDTLDPHDIHFYGDVQRVQTYTESIMEMQISINGKNSSIELISEPIRPQNYYVGTVEEVDPNGLISFVTEKGNLAFAKQGDKIILPEQLDSHGIIISDTNKGV